MLKAIVIGSPGAGKSTFAQRLSSITGLSLYHLDLLWHNSDKTSISREEFDLQLTEILKRDEWIIDGDYQRTLEGRLQACDTVFLLSYPTEVCLLGAKTRIGKERTDLPWVEDKLDQEMEKKIVNFSKEKLPRIYELLKKYQNNRNIIVFKTREEADSYLEEMASK